MKKIHLLILNLVCAFALSAQNKVNLVIFSEDSEPFYAVVNGVKQNPEPETNVRVTNLSPNINLRIVFANKDIPELKKTMSLEAGFEHTARIKRDRNKQFKLQYFGQVPMDESTSQDVPTVEYHTAEDHSVAGDPETNSVTGSTVTSQTTYGDTSPASVNVTMPGVSISMNTTAPQTQIKTTTTTTVTRSATTSHSNTDRRHETSSQPAVRETERCRTAMSPASFSKMKESVASKPFSDTKMSTAKVATRNSCLSVNQVKEIAKLFNMDDDKLAFAKFAYDHCVDKGNYYQVSEVFSFSSTTDELNKFLEK